MTGKTQKIYGPDLDTAVCPLRAQNNTNMVDHSAVSPPDVVLTIRVTLTIAVEMAKLCVVSLTFL